MESVVVSIPTRDRPEKLGRCLEALGEARGEIEFSVVVCDSTRDPELRSRVEAVCRAFPFARLHLHAGRNVAAARNACVRASSEALLVNVDDDIVVERSAIAIIVDRVREARRPSVVAGTVAFPPRQPSGSPPSGAPAWSVPIVMRWIGYGRAARPGEPASFLIGAFFAYPRAIPLAWPWNERIRTSDDRFMGALWRSKGIPLLFEPAARAVHDVEGVSYGVEEQASHIYVNLFDSLIANPSLARALSYEVLGFAAGARAFARSPRGATAFIAAWAQGHRALIRDSAHLRRMLRADLDAERS